MTGARATLLLLVVVAACTARSPEAAGRSSAERAGVTACPVGFEREVVDRVNAARRKHGRKPLTATKVLGEVANARARTMAARGRLTHAGFEEDLRDAGVKGARLAENVAWNYASPRAVVDGWLASPGHRANILERGFGRIGVGCARDAAGHPWWAQEFEGS